MVGGGMLKKDHRDNQGELSRFKPGVHVQAGPKSPGRAVRASIVAGKPGNAGRAKGRRKVDTRMDKSRQDQPEPVSRPKRGRTRPDGDVRSRWPWTKACVWTPRMLTALEQRDQTSKWHSLIDKVYRLDTLREAADQVVRNRGAAGVDHVSVGAFRRGMDEHLSKLHEQLKDGSYRVQANRRVYIPKPGKNERRPLGIPTVRDRVVQTALRSVIEPIFERDFAEHSYGFRPGRSAKDALRRVNGLLRQGYTFIVDADLRSYFDTIPHGKLMALIGRKISDRRVLGLIEEMLRQEVFDGLERHRPEAGSPQGAVISPLLSNIYLDGLDHMMAGLGYEMVRYADDLVILCRSQREADAALAELSRWVEEAELRLHPEKTRVVRLEEGFEFLGYLFIGQRRYVRRKSQMKLQQTLREKTSRMDGRSFQAIIADVNGVLRSWYAYFKHVHWTNLAKVDQGVRRRLRTILRWRSGRKGIAKGEDHHRWKNAWFDGQGLFSLRAAHARECQSSRR